MTTEISKQPGLPAYEYSRRIEATPTRSRLLQAFGWLLLLAGSFIIGCLFALAV